MRGWLRGVAAMAMIASAFAAQAQEAVCLGKTDRTGGALGFIVLARDAAAFEEAGFARMACPADVEARAAGLLARCARFEGQGGVGRAAIEDLYGLSVAEMCRATRAWAASAGGGGGQ